MRKNSLFALDNGEVYQEKKFWGEVEGEGEK